MEITDNLKASIDRKLIYCGLFLDFSDCYCKYEGECYKGKVATFFVFHLTIMFLAARLRMNQKIKEY